MLIVGVSLCFLFGILGAGLEPGAYLSQSILGRRLSEVRALTGLPALFSGTKLLMEFGKSKARFYLLIRCHGSDPCVK